MNKYAVMLGCGVIALAFCAGDVSAADTKPGTLELKLKNDPYRPSLAKWDEGTLHECWDSSEGTECNECIHDKKNMVSRCFTTFTPSSGT